jgi:hypothetical protein
MKVEVCLPAALLLTAQEGLFSSGVISFLVTFKCIYNNGARFHTEQESAMPAANPCLSSQCMADFTWDTGPRLNSVLGGRSRGICLLCRTLVDTTRCDCCASNSDLSPLLILRRRNPLKHLVSVYTACLNVKTNCLEQP